MVVKTINMVQHLMDRYGKITENALKMNQKGFNEALNTTMTIGIYFEIIDDCIQYSYDRNQPYIAAHIINNFYNTVLATILYNKPSKM